MKLPRSFAVVTTCAALAACAKGGDTAPAGSASASAAASAAPADDVEAFLRDPKAELSEELYDRLVAGMAECTLVGPAVDPKCAGYDRFRRARSRAAAQKNLGTLNANVGRKHIGHASAAVRLQAAQLLQSAFGVDASAQGAVVEAGKKETEPAVLAAMLRVVGSRHKQAEDVKALLLQMADHADETVRKEALSWFLTSFGEGVPGTFEKVLERMEKDPSVTVRAFLCDRLYGSGDERALPVFEKLLKDKETPKQVYDGCWSGLIKSWTGFPRPSNPSKKGYELTLSILEAKPRTGERPSWSGLANLRAAQTEFRPNDKFGTEWFEKVKPWYKRDRLLKVLEDLVTDPKANWMARTGAVDVMKELGAPKAVFERLLKKYEKADKGDDAHVKRRVEDALRRLAMPPASGSILTPPGLPPGHPGALPPGHPGHPGGPPPGAGGPPPGAPPAPPPRPQ
ncbi:MAG: HEAT repeat domain-containing protein [Polyangiaceae bacterium]|nr:HEAT repeat domain-containing protein [Polyangiaceae bacterium]